MSRIVAVKTDKMTMQRLIYASVYACQMLEAVYVIAGRRKPKGVHRAHVELRRALKAAGVPAKWLTVRGSE